MLELDSLEWETRRALRLLALGVAMCISIPESA